MLLKIVSLWESALFALRINLEGERGCLLSEGLVGRETDAYVCMCV